MSTSQYTYLVFSSLDDWPEDQLGPLGRTHIWCTFARLKDMVTYVNWHFGHEEDIPADLRLVRMRNGHEDSEYIYKWADIRPPFGDKE